MIIIDKILRILSVREAYFLTPKIEKLKNLLGKNIGKISKKTKQKSNKKSIKL